MRVEGYCPMGCGQTLVVDDVTRHIVCSYVRCPAPAKVDEVLSDAETEHIVQLGETTFTVLHPLRERPEELLTCDLVNWLNSLDGPAMPPGRYRAGPSAAGGWGFQQLTEETLLACAECGDDHAEYRTEFDRVLCGQCFTNECDEVDADRQLHAQRDEGER